MPNLLWQDLVGEVLDHRFQLAELCDSGRYQAEFLARPVEGEAGQAPVSVTVIQAHGEEAEQLHKEVEDASQFQHEHVVRILSTGICSLHDTGLVYLATESSTRSLAQARKERQFTNEEARELTEHLLAGLQYLHGRGFVYSILDPANVVRVGNDWKLGDLGQMQLIGHAPTIRIPDGSARPAYYPPEAASGLVSAAWDIWGLGVLLKEVVDGHSQPFAKIIRACLRTKAADRPSIDDVRSMLAPTAAPLPSSEEEPSRRSSRWPLIAGAGGLLLIGAWFVSRSPDEPAPASKVAAQQAPAPKPPSIPLVEDEKPSPMRMPSRQERAVRPSAPAPVKTPPQAQPKVAPPPPANVDASGASETGRADFFQSKGGVTASGEVADSQEFTAAHAKLPLGTRVKVTNLKNGKSVVVRINDRRSANGQRIISVSRQAAEALGFVSAGSAMVRLDVIR